MTEAGDRQIEGVGRLDFSERGSSVMGALALLLETIGDPVPYAHLMGASGQAFRLQIASPAWCPSAPHAGVGFNCVAHAAAALGRTIEWIPADPNSPQPMARRMRAIVESIDRGVPCLYGAEECGLVVGYRRGGRQLALRTYFDTTDAYTLIDRLGWPSPGILGESRNPPSPSAVLARSIELASRMARCTERFPMHQPGRVYVCGLAAYGAWIEGLEDEARFEVPPAQLAPMIQANSWCYHSLIDARRAAAVWLDRGEHEVGGEVAACLSRAAAYYTQVQEVLQAAAPQVPHPRVLTSVGAGGKAGAGWPVAARHAQAAALRAAQGLEQRALSELDALRDRIGPVA